MNNDLEALERQFKESGDLCGRLREKGEEIRQNRYEQETREAMTLGYPRCPKCGKVMSYEEVPKPGSTWVRDVRWYCFDCKTERLMSKEEFTPHLFTISVNNAIIHPALLCPRLKRGSFGLLEKL